MNSTINLTFRYEENDYVRALRAHYASHLMLRLDIVGTIIVGIAGAFLLGSARLHWLGVACVVIAVVFVLLLIAAFTVIPRLIFRREPRYRDEYSLTFSSDGIHFRTAHIDSQLQWSMYTRASITAHSYILYYGSRQFTVVPKRAFRSAEQQQAFERLMTQRIPQILRREV